MADSRFSRIEQVFGEALDLPAGERAAFLDAACAGDSGLRREVESLLRADEDTGNFLEQPAARHGMGELLHSGAGDRPEGRVGQYRLLRKIGEGGMSEVYLAVRADDEYKKSVAVKVIRRGLDRTDILSRFRTERQILAGLDHPNIAKLLDGGTTDKGLPYFVMDYIDGTPIDEHCDRMRLPVAERLDLFRTVCSAVQYAHQNLVVHRDIKASNILVTADGVPKLLDFGIAKLLKPDQFAQPVEYTATWMRPMTPRYASPEQVQGKLVGTPSDVYSLGVLLYKLLTGHLPYDLEGKPPTELARLVVEQEPETPSAAVIRGDTTAGGGELTPDVVGRARDTQPQQLRRILAGDLDNILLMSLRKEPQRRYASVEQFSEDIRRYMEGLPVIARGDSFRYRTTKFLRRNRVAVAAVAAFVVLLVGFAATMAGQAARISRERDQARLERDRAQQVVGFMERIFEVADPIEASGQNISAREILDRGASRVAAELQDQPEIKATLMQAIGNVYRNLGLYREAKDLLVQAVASRREALGNDHPDVAESLTHLGKLLRLKGDYDEAETALREAVALRSQAGVDTPELAESLSVLGVLLKYRGRYDEARAVLEESMRMQQATLPDHADMATRKNNLAAVFIETGDFKTAEGLLWDALAHRRRVLGEEHPMTAQSMNNLGVLIGMQERYDEAEPLLRDALRIRRGSIGVETHYESESLNNLGKLLLKKGDLAGAERMYREALEIEMSRRGDHPRVLKMMSNLAEVLVDRGKYDEAETLARRALDARRQSLGDRHADVATSLKILGNLLVLRGAPAEAEPLFREGLSNLSSSLPGGHWRTAEMRSLLGDCVGRLGRAADAEPLLLAAFESLQAQQLSEPTQAARDRLVRFYESAGRAGDAARYRGGGD